MLYSSLAQPGRLGTSIHVHGQVPLLTDAFIPGCSVESCGYKAESIFEYQLPAVWARLVFKLCKKAGR